jgi:hypothetical protein
MHEGSRFWFPVESDLGANAGLCLEASEPGLGLRFGSRPDWFMISRPSEITNPLHLLDVIRCGPKERTGWLRLIAEVSAANSRRF